MATATTAYKAGDEVMSWCTKCKEMHLHNVKAVGADGIPARVICTCTEKRERNFRPDPPKAAGEKRSSSSSSTASAAPKRASKKVVESPQVQWQKLIDGTNREKSRTYEMNAQFAQGDLLDHSKFGPGVVTELLDAHKMVVVFEDKTRIMIFNKHH